MSTPKHLAIHGRRTALEWTLLVLGAALAVFCLLGATALAYVNVRFGQITTYDDVTIDVAPAAGEPRNYLLVGSDSRAGLDPSDPTSGRYFDPGGTVTTGGARRTDTIMILRIDPENGEAWLLSLPRDLWVPIADGGTQRINTAFSRGRDVLINTIRQDFGIPIHHYVEIDFAGFLGLVDAVGGVSVYFSDPVRDNNSGLSISSPGCHVLDGTDALAFVRSRHLVIQDAVTGRWRSDPSGDFGRISRQQLFIRNAISKAVSRGLSNPVTLNELVDVGVDFVGLDPTLTVTDLLGLGKRFAAFDADDLQTYSVPATPFVTAGGASVLDLDERAAEPIFNIFRGLAPGEVTPPQVEVTVLNATGEDGIAHDVTAALDQIGFHTGTPSNADTIPFGTTVRYAPGSEAAASLLARHSTSSVRFEIDPGLDEFEVEFVISSDFTTLHDQPSPDLPVLPTTTTTTVLAVGGPSSSVVPATTTSTTAPLGYTPDEPAFGEGC